MCSTILFCSNIISIKNHSVYYVKRVKLFNYQLNRLKLKTKNNTEVTLFEFEFGDSNDENNFLHKFLSTNIPVRKAFANVSPANIKLSKTHLRKIGQSGAFLGRL